MVAGWPAQPGTAHVGIKLTRMYLDCKCGPATWEFPNLPLGHAQLPDFLTNPAFLSHSYISSPHDRTGTFTAMISRKLLQTTLFPRSVFPRFYSQSSLSSSPSIVLSHAPISRLSRLAKPAFIPPIFGIANTTFSTMFPSKRDSQWMPV